MSESEDDLYARLGVSRDATTNDIRRAYRKGSMTAHPDRGGTAAEFQRLHLAYEVLMDPVRRAEYDATGRIGGPGLDSGPGPTPDLSEIFGAMFGMGRGGSGMPAKTMRGPNKVHEIGVPLRDFYHGKQFQLHMTREVLCPTCDGEGGAELESCAPCRGSGFKTVGHQMGPIIAMTRVPCDACGQTGRRVVVECSECTGRRVMESAADLTVVIEPGMDEGDRIVFPGKCSESPLFEIPGDVVLVLLGISEEWVRRGADLHMELNLTLAESMLGWERRLTGHPSGRNVPLAWTGGVVRDGEVLRVPGWGMPRRGGGFGDLRLLCRVGNQGAWSEEQRSALMSVWPEWKEPVIGADTSMPVRL